MSQRSVIAVEADIERGRHVFAVGHGMGFDVRVFRDALDALMEAARSKPDVMVFDVDTPVLGSLDFAHVVSHDPQFKSVELIAIVDETDAGALPRYSARGIAVAVRRKDKGKTLRRELSRLLQPFAVRESSAGRGAHCRAREKGAA